ncbi:MAG: hypothetical protein HY822_21685 [Acidobacteria bacterium]|nr:hypothetical protein [Acidobacteriota bacterium]
MKFPALFTLLSLSACAAGLEPFPMDWRAGEASPADVSFLLDAPAGRHGFLASRGGHLVWPGGRRFRIWGVNFTAAATTPAKEDAPRVAAHLARFGINCVRFHFLDRTAPNGLLDATRDDTRAFDAAHLDRFDFFVAELKKRGIYTNINLNVGRTYKAGDGVKDHELLGFAKALTYFDPRLLELQRECARALLTHRNPYTGAEYRHEPAVAIVELVNENSLVESWFSGRLLGQARRPNPGTWTDIPASYERDLTRLFHAWLKKEDVARLAPKEFAAAPRERFHREAAFYMDLERRYFRQMGDFLKRELGVKAPIAGTSDHNHGASGYPLLASASQLDIVDGHVYWQHPRYFTDPATGRQTGFEIGNSPMVNDPLNSTVVQLSRSAVAGKPYTVSEVNHPFPAEYAAEGIPILAAYAALQDWDGLFWYTFEHKTPAEWRPVQPRYFEIRPDPVKMAQIAAGALVFLRADVRAAVRTVKRSYSMDEVRESIRMDRRERPFFTPGFPPWVPLRSATRIESFERAELPRVTGGQPSPIVSDTGELAWQHGEQSGLVRVDTPRSQALIGFGKARREKTANLSAAVDNEFCAITLGSLDGKPVAEASRLLLTTGARVANTGMQWDEKRKTLLDWGTEPTVIEPVTGAIVLTGLKGAVKVSAQPLDGGGRPLGALRSAKKSAAGWEIPVGRPATVWYAIAVDR